MLLSNLTLIVLALLFSFFWLRWSVPTVLWALRPLQKKTQGTRWILGLILLTTLLLTCFFVFGLALPSLLQALYDGPTQVNISFIAILTLACLSINWLLSATYLRGEVLDSDQSV